MPTFPPELSAFSQTDKKIVLRIVLRTNRQKDRAAHSPAGKPLARRVPTLRAPVRDAFHYGYYTSAIRPC